MDSPFVVLFEETVSGFFLWRGRKLSTVQRHLVLPRIFVVVHLKRVFVFFCRLARFFICWWEVILNSLEHKAVIECTGRWGKNTKLYSASHITHHISHLQITHRRSHITHHTYRSQITHLQITHHMCLVLYKVFINVEILFSLRERQNKL